MGTLLKMITSRVPLEIITQAEGGDNYLETSIPEERFREADLERRVVLTKEKLSFAFYDDENEIDYIPLSEVESVSETKEMLEAKTENMIDAGVVLTLQIATKPDGYNSGRTYFLRADTNDVCQTFADQLKANVKQEKRRAMEKSKLIRIQHKIKKIYDSNVVQAIIALIITTNFACTIVEAQEVDSLTLADGSASALATLLNQLNEMFTFIFLVDLCVNAFAHWFKEFATDVWNLLDIIIVAMSLLSVIVTNQPTGIVRIMRALRVIRLFGRLKALKKIISALSLALMPVLNVFLILFLLLSIGAIVGVTLFHDDDPDDFAVFSIAFFTLFHVTAGEPWPHTLPRVRDDGTLNWTVAIFTMVYTIVVIWVVLEVSVAVLLDNFISASTQMAIEEKRKQAKNKHKQQQLKNPLEPLLLKLAREFIDNQDLSTRLQKLYKVLDTDKSGSLDSMEFCSAIKKLDFTPRIHISDSDFESLTQNGELCDENGELGPEEFEMVMRKQIRHMAQSRLSLVSDVRSSEETDFMLHGSLKMIFMEQTRIEKVLEQTASDVRNILASMPFDDRVSPIQSPPTPGGGNSRRSRRGSMRKVKSLKSGGDSSSSPSNAAAVAETLRATAAKLLTVSDSLPPPALLPLTRSAEFSPVNDRNAVMQDFKSGRDTNPGTPISESRIQSASNSQSISKATLVPQNFGSGNPTPGERSNRHGNSTDGSDRRSSSPRRTLPGHPDIPENRQAVASASNFIAKPVASHMRSPNEPHRRPSRSSRFSKRKESIGGMSISALLAGNVDDANRYQAEEMGDGVSRLGPGGFVSLAEYRGSTQISSGNETTSSSETHISPVPNGANDPVKGEIKIHVLRGPESLTTDVPAAACMSDLAASAQQETSPTSFFRRISSDSNVSVDSTLGFSRHRPQSLFGVSDGDNANFARGSLRGRSEIAGSFGIQV